MYTICVDCIECMAGDVNLFFTDPEDRTIAEIELMIAGQHTYTHIHKHAHTHTYVYMHTFYVNTYMYIHHILLPFLDLLCH